MTLQWTERFSCYKARLPAGDLDVAWTTEGYSVQVFGRRLKAKSLTLEAGQRRAIKAARTMLTEALAALPATDENAP
jgi:hypothetical protein